MPRKQRAIAGGFRRWGVVVYSTTASEIRPRQTYTVL